MKEKNGFGCISLSLMCMDHFIIINHLIGNVFFHYFLSNRNSLYTDPIPRRHKFEKEKSKPLYSISFNEEGENMVDYITRIQLYFSFCELIFIFPIIDIEKDYFDSLKPFGHERILYTMLMLNPEDYL